ASDELGRCALTGGHFIPSRFRFTLGDGDDVLRATGPRATGIERNDEIFVEGGNDDDMLFSRLNLSDRNPDFPGQILAVDGGQGDDLLDVRDTEGGSADCGAGEDTIYLDAPGTTQHGRVESSLNCEHEIVGADPLAAVQVALDLPANDLTGNEAPRI